MENSDKHKKNHIFCKGPSKEYCNQFCFQMDKWFQQIFTDMVLD